MGAELGWDEARARARGGGLPPRRPPPRASWSRTPRPSRPAAASPVGPFTAPRRLDPHVCARRLSPRSSPCPRARSLAPAAHAGWFAADAVDGPADDRRARRRRPRPRRLGRARLPQARRRRRRRSSSRAWTRAPGSRRRSSPAAAPVDRGGRDRDRRRPAGRAWIAGGEVWATVIPAAARAQAPAPPVAARRRRRERRRDRHGHQRGRLRRLVGGRRRARRAPGRHRPGRRWPAPLDVDVRAHGRRRAALRPRVAVSAEGNAVATWARDRRGRAHPRRGAPPHRPDAVLVPAGPHARLASTARPPAAPTRRTSTSRTTARSPGSSSARTSAGARGPSARRLRGSLFEAPVRDRRRRHQRRRRGSTSTARASAARSSAADGNAVFSAYLDKFDAFQPGARLDADGRRRRAGAGRRDLRARRRLRRLAHRRRRRRRRARAPQGRREGLRAASSSPPTRRSARSPPGQRRDRRRPLRQHRRRDAPGHRRRAPDHRRASTTARPGAPVVHRARSATARRKPLIKWRRSARRSWGAQTFTVRVDGKVRRHDHRERSSSRRRALGNGPAQRTQVDRDRPPRPGRAQPHADASGSTRACRRCRSRSAAAGRRVTVSHGRARPRPGRPGLRADRLGRRLAQAARAAARCTRYKRGPLHAEGRRRSTRPAT